MDGILLVNKPCNMTSRDVVNIISKQLNISRVGHTGTLDPLAKGVLGIAINKGLKIVDFLINDTKEYIATVKMGVRTDTLDVTGNVLEEVSNFAIDKEKLMAVLHSFLGKSIQEVPLYSAIKVNGMRLYDYARSNKEVILPKREIEVFDIKLQEVGNNTFTFKVTVSKGTYIRSLIRDIGNMLGIPCTMQDLIRTKQGHFKIEDSYSLEDIKNGQYTLISLKEALQGYKVVTVDSYIEQKIANGRVLENRYQDNIIVFVNNKDQVLAIYEVYKKDTTKIKPIKVLI